MVTPPVVDSDADSEASEWTRDSEVSWVSSPEHSAPHAEAAAEDLMELHEGDAGKPPFARVLVNIRSLNKLQATAPKKVCEAYSTIEVEQGAVPKPSVPISLPCLLYTSPSPRDGLLSRMPSSA